ncbi:MAG: hypothetical protein D6800_06560, partial [Candidatus Zixiibacteriota bacterium]
MSKKLLSLLVLAGLLMVFMTVTVAAKSAYPWQQKKNHYSFRRMHRKPVAHQMATPEMEQAAARAAFSRGTGRASLGTANVGNANSVPSPGFTIIQTYEDWQYSHSKKRVDFNGTPVVHFTYSRMQSPDTQNPNDVYGYDLYDPTDGSITKFNNFWLGLPPGGIDAGCKVQNEDGSIEGLWPSLAIKPGSAIDTTNPSGLVVMAGSQGSTASGFENYFVWGTSPYSCFWGLGASIPHTDYITGFVDTSSVLNHPWVATQVCGSDTILHVLAHESRFTQGDMGHPLSLGRVATHFRKLTWGETGTWEGPHVIDTQAYRASMAVQRTGCKVAVAYIRPTPAAAADPNLCSCDQDVYYRESTDGGVTWGPRTDASNYDRFNGQPSESPWIETDCMYDSDGFLHIIWNGNGWPANPYDDPDFQAYIAGGEANGVGFWNEFSCNLVHWSERNPTVVSKIADANFGLSWNTQVCGFGGFNMMYIGAFNISECNGHLYVTWSQWNDVYNNYNRSQLTIDDCSSFNPGGTRVQAANAELNLSVSTNLNGLLWDLQRNLTDSYTPNCDSATGLGGNGICDNDTKGSLSRYGMDEAAMSATWGSLTWPAGSVVDPSGGAYTGTSYLQLMYLDDHIPGNGVFLNDAAAVVKNDIKWIRLACVDPVTAPQIKITPSSAGYPDHTDHGVPVTVTVTITNDGNATLNISNTIIEETTGPTGWLTVSGMPATVPAGVGNTATFDITINSGGIVNSPGTIVALTGRVRIVSDAPSPRDTLDFTIDNFIVGPVQSRTLDTVNTGTIQLAVSNNGEWGESGIGGANLDYTSSGQDCDSAADIYLFDGTPLVIQEVTPNTDYKLAANLYLTNLAPTRAFKPLSTGATAGSFVGPAASDAYRTSTFVNQDTTLAVEQEYYAPTDGAPNDDFIVICTRFFSPTGAAVPNLMLGDLIDWDVPSEPNAINVSGVAGKTVYVQGTDSTPTPTACSPFSGRFAGETFLGMYLSSEFNNDACANNTDRWGTFAANNSDENINAPNGAVDSALAWTNAGALTGEWAIPDTADLRVYTTYKYNYT